ncbi:hypothetical protein MKX01_026169 [Papaver californicum]|nr:hypothetical protein MKX01_026169 [Papaver californicum]
MKPSDFHDQIDFAKMSVVPFNKLVKLAARAFYDDDIRLIGDKQPKNVRSDSRGMSVVILDALTRRHSVREEDLAKDLKLGAKQLRQTLCAQRFNANTTDGHAKEGEKKKVHIYSYCCLDYSQVYDVGELDSSNNVEEYVCPRCNRRYNALDALQLISPTGEGFHCENCNGDLKLAADEMGGGDITQGGGDGKQLKPLLEQLDRVGHLTCPEFCTLKDWEARARAANGDAIASGNDPSKSSQGTPLPFIGDTNAEIELSGASGMNLPKEQLGEVLPSDRQVGMKSKREDVEWEDARTTVTSTETYKLNELKVYAEESEEDEIDWEDG